MDIEQGCTVLLVDDEASVIRALKRVFREDGYRLLSAENSDDALALIQNNRIDLIICDHMMPNMSGVELLTCIRRISPETIRILITGANDINVAISAINEGRIYHYITKPWKNDEIRKIVREALALRQKRRKLESVRQILSSSRNYLHNVTEKLNTIGQILEEDQNARAARRRAGIGKIPVYEDDDIVLIDIKDIRYISAQKGYVTVVTGMGSYITKDPLNSWEKNLEEHNFFRCHRSYIINVDQISRIMPWFNGAYTLTLNGSSESIPVSRNRMKQLKRMLTIGVE
jgi:two-component system response regulator LytT